MAALTSAGWTVRGFDRVASGTARETAVGDLADAAAVSKAARGAGALVHLGATPDDDDFFKQLLPGNVIGLYNVMEAARAAGMQRIILASTGQVNWWQQIEGPWPNRANDPVTPRHWYAATKVMAEAAGYAYARAYNMTVLVVRLGWCPRTREQVAEIAALERGQDTYLSPADAGRFFVRAIEAPLQPGFHVVFATSRPIRRAILDREPARRLLGFEPQDQWPAGAEEDLNPAG